MNEEAFQEQLDKCNTEQERQALITETLNGLYSETADKYREVNAEVIAANEAQDKWNQAMAAVGGAIEPFVTAGKLLLAEVLERLTPIITNVASFLIPWLTQAFATVAGWVDTLVGKVSGAGFNFGAIMDQVKAKFELIMGVLRVIWDSVGQPMWNLVKQAVLLVAGYFQEKMPAIKEFVRQAFDDIKRIWENNLQPALRAIGDFINNVLAPAFEFVFKNVIRPVVDEAFRGIKQLWTGTLKPVLEGILDFITGVFTLNFEKAFEGLSKAVGGIMSGLKTVVKTPLNAVIDVVNGFIRGLNKLKIPDWVPGVGGHGINIPTIPKLEEGGVLARGQVGLLEGNGAEAVVPLDKNKAWISAVARDMDAAMGGASGTQVVALLADILDQLADIASMGITLDTGALVGGLAKPMDRKLGQIQAQKARA